MELRIGRIYNNIDVRNLVCSIHDNPQDIKEGDLIERIDEFGKYVLEEIDVSKLRTGFYAIDEEHVEEIMNMSGNVPPVVLGFKFDNDTYDVIDGNHRVAAEILKQSRKILAFIPIVEE